MSEVPSDRVGEQGSFEQLEAITMSTLTILAKVNIHFDMTSSDADTHEARRMIVIGICHERMHSTFNLLARLTCETPESASALYSRWRKLPPEVREAWHTLCR
jgi:hypothetical protein